MPTQPPAPVKPARGQREIDNRKAAVNLVERFLSRLADYAYDTRSYMPGGLDYTDFDNALGMVRTFCQERPDWTLEAVLYVVLGLNPHNVGRRGWTS